MLVFALVMVFSIFQYMQVQESRRTELTEKEALLSTQQGVLDAQQIELEEQRLAFETVQALMAIQSNTLMQQSVQLQASQTELEQKQTELDASALSLADAQTLIAAAQLSLQTQQEQMDAQQAQLLGQQTLMAQQQQRIEALVGVRAEIVQTLSTALRDANLSVAVDAQTGAITMQGAVLFDVNKSDLKPGGMTLLDEFIPLYVRTLLSGEYRDFVAEIIIEGHTDTDGPFLENLRLSQDRAYAVAQYCLQDGFGGMSTEERDLLRVIVTANGRSWSNPIYRADGTVDKEASRRVEFKFRLKDAEMISEMQTLMEHSEPAAVQ